MPDEIRPSEEASTVRDLPTRDIRPPAVPSGQPTVWTDPGVGSGTDVEPTDPRYGDTYFTPGHGYEESRHVFILGNEVPERVRALSAGSVFRIGETGFGTGLNLWTLVRELSTAEAAAAVHYYSLDHCHLPPERVRSLLRPYSAPLGGDPALDRILEAYRALIPDGRNPWGETSLRAGAVDVRVRVYWGDVEDAFAAWTSSGILFDAWFFDGYAPDRNPRMWSRAVIGAAASLTAAGGTAATYTAAGSVKSALRAAGFTVVRRKGFGRKRHMTTARMP